MSTLLCGWSQIMCIKHLTESLASSWFPSLPRPHPHLSKWHLCPAPFSGQTPRFCCWYLLPPHIWSVNPTTSRHLCCCPGSNQRHLLLGLLQELPTGLSVSILVSLKSLVNSADRMCHCTVSWCMSLFSHFIQFCFVFLIISFSFTFS